MKEKKLTIIVDQVTGEEDYHFLQDMLYEAAAVDPLVRQLGKEESLKIPAINKYLSNWGRKGDYALIAFDGTTKERLGAAWYRLFAAKSPGYGYMADDIPEVSMAVVAEHRGKGIGSILLNKLIEQAKKERFPALSLSVAKSNPAKKLYEKMGFIDAGISRSTDSSIVLVFSLCSLISMKINI